MPATVRVNSVLLCLCLTLLALQGCGSVSEDGGDQRRDQEAIRPRFVTPSGTTLVADGSSFVPIQLTVTDASGNPRAGIAVSFSTTVGSLSTSTESLAPNAAPGTTRAASTRQSGPLVTVTTNPQGLAEVFFLSTTIGTARITADVGEFRTSITVEIVAGAPATLQLTTSAETLRRGETATLEATVTDGNNNPVAGTAITFALLTNASGASLQSSRSTTGADGKARVVYTAGQIAGRDTVQATTTNDLRQTVTVVVTIPIGAISLSADPTSIVTTTSRTGITAAVITATVTATDGTGIPNVALTFNVDGLGNAILTRFQETETQTTTATTNGRGQATVTVLSGDRTGSVLVTVQAETATTSVTLTVAEASAVSSIVLVSISNASIGVRGAGTNETSTLAFAVRDRNGNLVPDPIPDNPASGTTVRFTLENGGLGGGESVNPATATAVNGQVTTTLQSGTRAGTVRVIAFIDANANNRLDLGEVASETIGVVITGGPPWGENLSVAVNPLNIAGLVTFGLRDTITAFLSDRFSNPVADGTAVFFFSDYAGITGSAVTSSETGPAVAIATLTSQGPIPPDGFVTVTPSTLSGVEARVLTLVVDPKNASRLYAGTDGGGVFRTINGLNADGTLVSWTQVGRAETKLTNGLVRDLRLDPTTTSILYAATDRGVFRSTGSGDAWEERSGRGRVEGEILGTIGAPLPRTLPLAFPSNGDRARTEVRVNDIPTTLYLFVGTTAIELLPGAGSVGDIVTIDYDLGASIPGGFRTTALALDPTDPLPADPLIGRSLYAGTLGAGIFRSFDSGFSWRAINNGLGNFQVLSLVALSPTTLYAGTFGGGVFRTFNATDVAPVWCPVSSGLSSTVINTLATDGTRVYAGTFLGGVFFLTDGRPPGGVGDCRTVAAPTWTEPTVNVDVAPDPLNTFVSDIVIDPNDPTTLYTATLGDGTRSIEGNAPEGGVFTSTDSGVTWRRIPALPPAQISLPPADVPDNRVYALGLPTRLADGSPATDTVYIGTAGRNVLRLTPSTVTFEVINGTPPRQLTNNIFVSTTVLFSGNTRITITQLSDLFQDQDRDAFGSLPHTDIFNRGSQFFVYTVSDQNGNPLTGGSTITVSVSAGKVLGNTSVTIPDTQRGSTVFGVSWINDIKDPENITGTLTVNVNSAPNGNATASLSRVLIGPVTVTPGTATMPAGGGTLVFTITGGSETTLAQGGGYNIASDRGTIAPSSVSFPGNFSLTTNAAANGTTITVTVTDRITSQQAIATVTQEQAQ